MMGFVIFVANPHLITYPYTLHSLKTVKLQVENIIDA